MTVSDTNWVELFTPGRLCLFGEHSDWASEYGLHTGFCLVIGTDQGLRAVARPSDDLIVKTQLPDATGRAGTRTRQITCSWNADTLMEAAQDEAEFFRYCAGTAHELVRHPGVTGGVTLHITAMDLPLKKGVSSSAAVCILVARAFNLVYNLGMFPHELMDVAFRGERLTGSQCGRMDQACIYGKTPVLLTFQKSMDVRVEPVFPGGDIDMFFVDLAGKKDTVRILGDLQNAYSDSPDLQAGLGEKNERILREAYSALGNGDAEALGRLMTDAQANFDANVLPCSPEELASPLLHELLAFEPIADHVYGGKGVGSQGDGTAQFVARSAADKDQAMRKISEAFPQMQCFPLSIVQSVGSMG